MLSFQELRIRITSIINVNADEMAYLLSNVQEKELSSGEVLVREGNTVDFVCYVKKGVLRSYLVKDAKEINTEFFFSDSFVSAFTSFSLQIPTALNIEALDQSTVIYIPKNLLDELYSRNPIWFALGKNIFEEEFIKKCKRESSFLLHDARERYLALLEQYPLIEKNVPLFHIASYLGIQPETLSRIRSGKFFPN